MNNVKGILFKYRIFWHILFWVVWYVFYLITYSDLGFENNPQYKMNLYLLPARMAMTYVLIYWILPRFLFTKKYLLFSFLIILHAVLFGLIITFQLDMVGIPSERKFQVIRPIIMNYQIPATAAAIVLFKRWYLIQQYSLTLEKDKFELEYEKLEAELNFLKSQIHPHFLFNTLNNLYALTLKKSDKASEVVIQLSNMLDHMLYSSRASEVTLEKEITQLKEYINLEQINYGNRLDLKIDITGDIKEKKIAPLIMLPFVENSFKHGVSNDTKSPFIKIKINVEGIMFYFDVENSYDPNKKKEESYSEGIGLSNVKRRLELLYPDKHQLKITKDNFVFQVSLEIDLSGGVFKEHQN